MKTLFKTRLLPFLLVAITALCALFGVILTTPNTVSADDSTTTETVDYSTLPSKDLAVGDNLFGKYLFIYTGDAGTTYAADMGFARCSAYFMIDASIITALGVYIDGVLYEGAIPEGIAYTYNGKAGYVYDFTKKITLTLISGVGESGTTKDVTMNYETLGAVSYFDSECPTDEYILFFPTENLESKPLEVGDNLFGNYLYVECEDESGVAEFFCGVYITICDGSATVFGNEIIINEEDGSGHIMDTGTDLAETYPIYSYGDGLVIFFDKAFTYEDSCSCGCGLTKEYTLDDTTLIVDEFIAKEATLYTTFTELPVDETPDTDDGSGSDVTDEDKSALDKVADWFDDVSAKASDWLAEHNVNVSPRALLVGAVGVAVIIAIVKRKRRRR